MKAYILKDYFGGEAYELNHAVILKDNVQEATQAIRAEITTLRQNGAMVRIPEDSIPELGIPSLSYRLQTGERVIQGYVICLALFETCLIS